MGLGGTRDIVIDYQLSVRFMEYLQNSRIYSDFKISGRVSLWTIFFSLYSSILFFGTLTALHILLVGGDLISQPS